MNPPTFLASSLLVAIGGGIGSWLRYMTGRWVINLIGPVAATAFPWATLMVNIVGSFAMGLLAGWLTRHGTGGETARLLLGVGVLGGFTTFSAFSLEFAVLVERGATATALFYAATSLLLGFAGLFIGLFVTRALA